MTDKNDIRKLRKFVERVATGGIIGDASTLCLWTYWLQGNRIGDDVKSHRKAIRDLFRHPRKTDKPELERKYPELYALQQAKAQNEYRLVEQLSRDIAGKFCDALLSMEELPAEGWDIVVGLAEWAYVMAYYDKMEHLRVRGKLSAYGFYPFISAKDEPAYPTREEWDDWALEYMNDNEMRWEAVDAASEYYRNHSEVFTELLAAHNVTPGKSISIGEAVEVICGMQQRGMKPSPALLDDYERRWEHDWSDDFPEWFDDYDPEEEKPSKTVRASSAVVRLL